MMIQHARRDQDHPFYLAVMQAQHPRQPIVFVGDDGKPWTLKPGQYDMSVVFPQAEYVKYRPDWLKLDGLRMDYAVSGELCRGKLPCLIEARYANEGDDAVAADRTVLDIVEHKGALEQRMTVGHAEAQSRLFLRPGSYRLTATDLDNHTLFARDIVVGNAIPVTP
jgi:hypothetical protein